MPDASGDVVANTYGEITRLVERLHRRYLDVIRYELSKLGTDDINVEPEHIDWARDYLRGLERVWSDSIQFSRG